MRELSESARGCEQVSDSLRCMWSCLWASVSCSGVAPGPLIAPALTLPARAVPVVEVTVQSTGQLMLGAGSLIPSAAAGQRALSNRSALLERWKHGVRLPS
jgi:hypothetical protein